MWSLGVYLRATCGRVRVDVPGDRGVGEIDLPGGGVVVEIRLPEVLLARSIGDAGGRDLASIDDSGGCGIVIQMLLPRRRHDLAQIFAFAHGFTAPPWGRWLLPHTYYP